MRSSRANGRTRTPLASSRVISGRPARDALRAGIVTMAAVLAPTLGPTAGRTAISGTLPGSAPEIVDSAGVIARRTIAIPGQYRNMGAMLLRQVVWTMHDSVGDGVATAAVVAAHLAGAASRYVDAGGDADAVLRGIRTAAASSLRALDEMVRPADQPDVLAIVAHGAIGEVEIAHLVAEAMDAAGPDGAVLIRDSPSGLDECEYAAGAIWDAGPLSAYLMTGGRVAFADPVVIVTDFEPDVEDVVHVLETCLAAGERSLLLIAPGLSTQAASLLVANRDRGVLANVLAVTGPSPHGHGHRALEDIAVIVGARLLSRARGDTVRGVTIEDFGRARHVWATKVTTGIVGGRGTVAARQRRLAEAIGELRAAETDDARQVIQKRIGRLASLTVTLRAGGSTGREREERKTRIESGVAAVRAAMTSGVVPGGGAALRVAAGAIELGGLEGDALAGARLFARSLEEPMRTIAANAGLRVPLDVGDALDLACCTTFDVRTGALVDPWQAGIIDSLAVHQRAIDLSVSLAATVLRTDTLVHKPEPDVSLKP